MASKTNLTARLGGASQVPQYTIQIGPNSDGTLAVQGLTHNRHTDTVGKSPDQQVVLTIDYTSVSQNPDYPLGDVAGVVANYMENTPVDGVLLADLPIHEIGVSRSTGLMDELNKALGEAGIWVDQETYNDPHPISAIGDADNTVYDNVAFADDYWRTSGQPETGVFYNGHAIDGAYSLELPFVQADSAGYVSPHLAVSGYYNATMDLASTYEGIGPEHNDWWGKTLAQPPRDQTGFVYSSIANSPRPVSGLWPASGGIGVRTPTVQQGEQWPNVTDVATTNGATFVSGSPIDISYLHQDRDDTSTVSFTLDTDQNALNNTGARILGSATAASSGTATTDTLSVSTIGVAPGKYWICASIVDQQGHSRYSYSQPILITAPHVASTLFVVTAAHGHPSVVTGATTTLIALGGENAGENGLTYTWTTIHRPPGAHNPTFSANGTNAAKTVRVAFLKDGSYRFQCVIRDGNGASVSSVASITVQQTATRMRVNPSGARIHRHHRITFHTVVYDQFGHALRKQPSIQYSILSGPASIASSSGVCTASDKTGALLINVDDDQLTTTVKATVVA